MRCLLRTAAKPRDPPMLPQPLLRMRKPDNLSQQTIPRPSHKSHLPLFQKQNSFGLFVPRRSGKESPMPAVNECIACEAPCCESCAALHISKPRFACHKILPIGKSRKMFCLAHMMELNQFCREDKLLICPQCIKKHPDHTVIPRSKAEDLMQCDIDSCREQLRVLQSTLKESQSKILGMPETVQTAEEKSLNDLEVLCDKAVDEIMAFKKQTHKKIKENFNGIKLRVIQKQNTLDLAEQNLKSLMQVKDGLELLQNSVYFLNKSRSVGT